MKIHNDFGYQDSKYRMKGTREIDKLAQWMEEIMKPEKNSTKKPSGRKRKTRPE